MTTKKNNLKAAEKQLPQRHPNSSLRANAAQEIINSKGGFLEKWALLLFLILSGLLLLGTWFIRYPDIIDAQARLVAENEPKEIVPQQTGRLVRLFVKNGDDMKKGAMIGWVGSTANTADVIALAHTIDSCTVLMSQGRFESIPLLLNTHYTGLGDLQVPYPAFITAFQQYNDYWVNGFYTRKKQMLVKDKSTLQELHGIAEDQKSLSSRDRDSAKVSIDMYRFLLKERIISAEEFRLQESKFIGKQMTPPQYSQNMLTNETQQRDKQKEIDQLIHDEQQQKIIFTQALKTFQSSINEWLHQYTILAPIAGKIVFTVPLQQNKYIESGKAIAFINPPGGRYYAEMSLSQKNFGKIEKGMKVQLRLDAYPYQETGFISAKISYISPVPIDTNFLATATLTGGLVTSLHKPVQYRSGLRAQALIITKDMRLLQRIYYNIIKSFSPK